MVKVRQRLMKAPQSYSIDFSPISWRQNAELFGAAVSDGPGYEPALYLRLPNYFFSFYIIIFSLL